MEYFDPGTFFLVALYGTFMFILGHYDGRLAWGSK